MRVIFAALILTISFSTFADVASVAQPAAPVVDPTDAVCAKASSEVGQPLHLKIYATLAYLCIQRRVPSDDATAEQRLSTFVQERMTRQLRLVLIRRSEAERLRAGSTNDAPDGSWVEVFADASMVSKIMALSPDKVGHLGPGPLIRLSPNPDSTEGHYGVTNQALKSVKRIAALAAADRLETTLQAPRGIFPVGVYESIADAAQDPDFYEWSTPAAHAQTPCNEAGDGAATACANGEPTCHVEEWKSSASRAPAACCPCV